MARRRHASFSFNSGGTNATAPAPAPAPAAPTPPVTPVEDSLYNQQISAINNRLGNQNLGFAGQESRLQSYFGFDPQYAQDPYTQANILARRASQREEGTLNAMASHGQLYSGAMNNARAADAFTSGQELYQARTDLANKLADIQQQRLMAGSQVAEDQLSAYGDALSRKTQADLNAAMFAPSPDAGGDAYQTPSYPKDAIAKALNIWQNRKTKSPAAVAWAKQVLGY